MVNKCRAYAKALESLASHNVLNMTCLSPIMNKFLLYKKCGRSDYLRSLFVYCNKYSVKWICIDIV